jgi:tol-pal system protein YbgF
MVNKRYIVFVSILCIVLFKNLEALSQDIDVDQIINKLERLEKNVSDLQKGKIEDVSKSISSGYISRNESRLDQIETNVRQNFGTLEEIQNQVNLINEKLDLINSDFQSRILEIEKKLEKINIQTQTKQEFDITIPKDFSQDKLETKVKKQENLSEDEIKKKYENAIKLLWASKFDEAEKELVGLKNFNPQDLMPNIQYWLGEVHYAQKKFEKAILEFGEGLKKYPDSIKGPDNMLKLGLSFANLEKKNEACNVFYELEIKYKSAPKNVLERANKEKKKLNCPKE